MVDYPRVVAATWVVLAALLFSLAGCEIGSRTPGKQPPPLESDQVALLLDGL